MKLKTVFIWQDILEIHKRVIGNVDPLEAGIFRTTQVTRSTQIYGAPSLMQYLALKGIYPRMIILGIISNSSKKVFLGEFFLPGSLDP